MESEEAVQNAEALVAEGKIIKLSDKIFIHADYVEKAKLAAAKILNDYHAKIPLSPGLPKEEFRNKLSGALWTKDAKSLELLIDYMAEINAIRWDINTTALPDFNVVYTKAQEKLIAEFAQIYKSFGHEPPEMDALLTDYKDKSICKQLILGLSNEGRITRLNGQVYMDTEVLNKTLEDIKTHIETHGNITLAELRDTLATSRKYALQLLEYCDEIKLTKLEGESRILY